MRATAVKDDGIEDELDVLRVVEQRVGERRGRAGRRRRPASQRVPVATTKCGSATTVSSVCEQTRAGRRGEPRESHERGLETPAARNSAAAAVTGIHRAVPAPPRCGPAPPTHGAARRERARAGRWRSRCAGSSATASSVLRRTVRTAGGRREHPARCDSSHSRSACVTSSSQYAPNSRRPWSHRFMERPAFGVAVGACAAACRRARLMRERTVPPGRPSTSAISSYASPSMSRSTSANRYSRGPSRWRVRPRSCSCSRSSPCSRPSVGSASRGRLSDNISVSASSGNQFLRRTRRRISFFARFAAIVNTRWRTSSPGDSSGGARTRARTLPARGRRRSPRSFSTRLMRLPTRPWNRRTSSVNARSSSSADSGHEVLVGQAHDLWWQRISIRGQAGPPLEGGLTPWAWPEFHEPSSPCGCAEGTAETGPGGAWPAKLASAQRP